MIDAIHDEETLEELLSRPSARLIEHFQRGDGEGGSGMESGIVGDFIVLGAGGKMGPSLATMARRAADAAGGERRVIAVARFSDASVRERLERAGVETISCDLLDRTAVARLPQCPNVVFMAGRKFGTAGDASLTWALNVVVPSIVAEHFAASRIVAFSTGCVYPLVARESGGSRETDAPEPIGEYAQSCLGRERVFEHAASTLGTPVCLLRLNYAIDMRYGVLHDVGRRLLASEPVDLTVGWFNCIWQGDANEQALLALEHCAAPAAVLNVTGPETISVRDVATRLAGELGVDARFDGAESPLAYLSDSSRARRLFGAPTVDLDTMLRWTAAWLRGGGRSYGKPTHFEVADGTY